MKYLESILEYDLDREIMMEELTTNYSYLDSILDSNIGNISKYADNGAFYDAEDEEIDNNTDGVSINFVNGEVDNVGNEKSSFDDTLTIEDNVNFILDEAIDEEEDDEMSILLGDHDRDCAMDLILDIDVEQIYMNI